MGIIVNDTNHTVLGQVTGLELAQCHHAGAAGSDEHGSAHSLFLFSGFSEAAHETIGETAGTDQNRHDHSKENGEAQGQINGF